MASREELLAGAVRAAYFVVWPSMLLSYDYLLTFEREVSLIWPSPWSIVKILFLLTRYTPFVGAGATLYYVFAHNISSGMCRVCMFLLQWSVFLAVQTSEGILFVRSWAVWNCNRRLAVALGVIMFAAAVCSATLIILWQGSVTFSTGLEIRGSCYIMDEGGLYAAAFGVIIISETCVLVLTILRMARQYRLVGKERFQSDFVTVLYRDGVMFFVYKFLLSVVNIVVILSAKGLDRNIFVMLQQAFHSILSTRVLLHLREVQRGEHTMESMSGILFSPPSHSITSRASNDGL